MPNAGIDPQRRWFLRGRVRCAVPPIRPPWALDEAEFIDRCERCDACIRACEPGILIRGDGGFPRVDFRRGGCTFCAACVEVCEPQVLRRHEQGRDRPWSLAVAIDDSCLSQRGITCRVCGDRCATGAIRFRLQTRGRAVPTLSAADCSGCGVCLSLCPADAIDVQALEQGAAA